jgi:hypothetical protein
MPITPHQIHVARIVSRRRAAVMILAEHNQSGVLFQDHAEQGQSKLDCRSEIGCPATRTVTTVRAPLSATARHG